MQDRIITNFQVSVYGKLEKFSDTISKGRCRVFYKGLNRNGTYITPEFADNIFKIYSGDAGDTTPSSIRFVLDDLQKDIKNGLL